MKKLLLISILVSRVGICFGQESELFGIEYASYQGKPVKNTDSAEVSFSEVEIAALFPVLSKEKFTFIAGGVYRLVIPEGDQRQTESNLFFLGAKLIGAYKLTDKSQLVLSAIPALSTTTDSRGISSDNILMQGALLYRKKVSEKFFYTLGVLSTSRFGSPLILPSVGLSHLGEKIKLVINRPFFIKTTWNHKSSFSYGLKLSVNGSQYNIDNEVVNGVEVDVVNFSRLRIGPELQCRIKGPLVFTLYGGLAASYV